jgi:hypothetical protein
VRKPSSTSGLTRSLRPGSRWRTSASGLHIYPKGTGAAGATFTAQGDTFVTVEFDLLRSNRQSPWGPGALSSPQCASGLLSGSAVPYRNILTEWSIGAVARSMSRVSDDCSAVSRVLGPSASREYLPSPGGRLYPRGDEHSVQSVFRLSLPGGPAMRGGASLTPSGCITPASFWVYDVCSQDPAQLFSPTALLTGRCHRPEHHGDHHHWHQPPSPFCRSPVPRRRVGIEEAKR